MSSVCAEQHKLHPSHQLHSSNKPLKSIEIPPRKLLSRRLPSCQEMTDMYYSRAAAAAAAAAEETLLQKYLPYNSGADDDDPNDVSDPYSSDHFRMYEFKVRHCTRSRSHDWTDCPFAHPGEKARRRDPRTFHYSGQVCPEYRRGGCSRGNSCEFAHGVFECWLHPARYRTEACKDGKNCKRKVCFFAHTPRQLRVLPPNSQKSPPHELASKKKFLSSPNHHCCLFCHCATTSSPTSTLMGISHFSPPLSPPLSPVKQRSINGFSPISVNHGVLSYKDVLTELMSSFEAMNFSEASSPLSAKSPNLPWLDVSFNSEDQQQFILSPSTPNPSVSANFLSGDRSSKSFTTVDSSDPDLGWVNELLM